MYDLRFAVSSVSPTWSGSAPHGVRPSGAGACRWRSCRRTSGRPRVATEPSLVEPADPAGNQLSRRSTATADDRAEPQAPSRSLPSSDPADAPVSTARTPRAATPVRSTSPKPQSLPRVEPQAIPDLEASAAEPLIPEPDTTSVDAPRRIRGSEPRPDGRPDASSQAQSGREASAEGRCQVVASTKPRPHRTAAPRREQFVRHAIRRQIRSAPRGSKLPSASDTPAQASWQKRQRHANCLP